ncbi:PhoPQ-activated pathogenicity-related family protein [Endozoicomonas sp. SESOKO4]|uniref:PhoPQ-activated pathogenicity-related family protein n=1 Tax=Endozoicomonas sp. SESOKO4 TaxID=2828745 RepID=UPI002147D348|nr:PhoPQ-activated pathogenicity-related family protein [Endozoicomonas sp. SESOKO4]
MNPEFLDFLNREDDNFSWRCLETCHSDEFPAVTMSHLELISQTWQEGIRFGLRQPEWQHRLTLYWPEEGSDNPCLLMIHGGSRHDPSLELTPSHNVDGARLCQLTKAPVAVLRDVPNQPLTFQDGVPRSEDDLVAFSWQAFLEDPENNGFMPVQWPMVKSVIRTMDALCEFSKKFSEKGSTRIDDFIIAGASKRGWISWLTAAADQRVMALIPMVIDALNIQACMHHHLNVYGGFASAIRDYADNDHDILSKLDSPGMQQLLNDIDPFVYRNQLFLPTFIVNASCDEFFPPDSARFYYPKLSELTWLRYLPNASHYLGRDSAVNIDEIMASVFGALISEQDMPAMNWRLLDDGGLEIRTSLEPKLARVWVCHNPDARDFRKDVLQQAGIRFQATHITPVHSRPWTYQFCPQAPENGWTAFFIELAFDNASYPDLILTSGVRVTPDVYP